MRENGKVRATSVCRLLSRLLEGECEGAGACEGGGAGGVDLGMGMGMSACPC